MKQIIGEGSNTLAMEKLIRDPVFKDLIIICVDKTGAIRLLKKDRTGEAYTWTSLHTNNTGTWLGCFLDMETALGDAIATGNLVYSFGSIEDVIKNADKIRLGKRA